MSRLLRTLFLCCSSYLAESISLCPFTWVELLYLKNIDWMCIRTEFWYGQTKGGVTMERGSNCVLSFTVYSHIYCLILLGRLNKNMEWTWRVLNVEEVRNACQILVCWRKGKRQIGGHNPRNGCDTRNRSIMAILYRPVVIFFPWGLLTFLFYKSLHGKKIKPSNSCEVKLRVSQSARGIYFRLQRVRNGLNSFNAYKVASLFTTFFLRLSFYKTIR